MHVPKCIAELSTADMWENRLRAKLHIMTSVSFALNRQALKSANNTGGKMVVIIIIRTLAGI